MLDPDVKALAEAKNFAVFTTLLSDGHPMAHVMWIGCDDDHLLINTEVHRAKFRNVERDPRVTVTIIDRDNPYRFAEVRGDVVDTVRGPEARSHIDALSQKYRGRPYDPEAIQTERVVLKIAPRRQLSRG
ncbi:MAG: PPOX class F420-dependent oxidoreductase [Actinobacteria bacterium]|nr:PPOX class F420-dependent oxidoreductase [Actinomycetota bacterium]